MSDGPAHTETPGPEPPVAPRPPVLWATGLVLGAADGLAIFVAGYIGVALVALTLALFALRGPRLFAMAGFVTGFGGVWTVVLAQGLLSCAATNARPGQSCGVGDNGLWLLGAIVVLVLGLVASVAAFRRAGDSY